MQKKKIFFYEIQAPALVIIYIANVASQIVNIDCPADPNFTILAAVVDDPGSNNLPAGQVKWNAGRGNSHVLILCFRNPSRVGGSKIPVAVPEVVREINVTFLLVAGFIVAVPGILKRSIVSLLSIPKDPPVTLMVSTVNIPKDAFPASPEITSLS